MHSAVAIVNAILYELLLTSLDKKRNSTFHLGCKSFCPQF